MKIDNLALGDIVRVNPGVIHGGLEFRVTAFDRHADGEALVIFGIHRFRVSDVQVIKKRSHLA